MTEHEAGQIEAAVREIEQYLGAHPHASDTLQGVRDWWLAGLGRLLGLDVVQVAIDRLVEVGHLVARPIPGGVAYSRAKYRNGECVR